MYNQVPQQPTATKEKKEKNEEVMLPTKLILSALFFGNSQPSVLPYPMIYLCTATLMEIPTIYMPFNCSAIDAATHGEKFGVVKITTIK